MNFSKDIKIINIETPVSGSSSTTSKVIDTAGFTGCCIVVSTGAITASAVTSIKVQEADAASDADTLTAGADLAGTSQTIADDDDGQLFVVDITRPHKRYLQLATTKATEASLTGAVAYLYDSDSSLPVTQATGSGVGEGVAATNVEQFTSPVAGTA